ncbi:MAG TPA: hypothetical protein VI895_12350 [Bdellovibrionota bacterium]|nr:hypothetical protein [Bdellovibrionota bacterium]
MHSSATTCTGAVLGEYRGKVGELPEGFSRLSPTAFDRLWEAEADFEFLDLGESSDEAMWEYSRKESVEVGRAANRGQPLATSHQLRAFEPSRGRLKRRKTCET